MKTGEVHMSLITLDSFTTPLFQSNTVISVEVLNINENPAFSGDTTLSVPESSPIATVVGMVTAVDPDIAESLTVEIQGVSQDFNLTNILCGQQVR